jgi:hypothetical protein
MTTEFEPDWCIAPAEHLDEWMTAAGYDTRILAALADGRDGEGAEAVIGDVLARRPLTAAHAHVLFCGTRVSAAFWLSLERSYRDGLAAGLADATSVPIP